MEHYDLVVIGAGPAGEKGAAQAAYFGKRVAIVEAGDEPGGATVHTGTLPSKTLREASLYLSGHRNRELYGVAVELNSDTTLTTLLERKGAISSSESRRMRENLQKHGVDYYRAWGRLVDAHTIQVGEDQISADIILLPTGSEPHRPSSIAFESDAIHDTDEILEITYLPKSMSIIGAGVIGCEYACMFAALGCEITLVDSRTSVMPFLDREIVERLQQAMENLGVKFLLGKEWEDISESSEGVHARFSDGSVLTADNLLFAAGRTGQTGKIGLENVELCANNRGHIEVDEHFRTAVKNIYAGGDCIGFPGLASTAMEQGRVAMCHAFDFAYKTLVSNVLPYGIYTIPEVSSVGETEQSAAEAGYDFVAGRSLYSTNARGMITGDMEGITKLIVERQTRKLLGIHVIGERATELVHIGQTAMLAGATVDIFIDMVFNFPTLAGSYKYAAYDCLAALSETD
jgi:NAD(P) transhydrogenase